MANRHMKSVAGLLASYNTKERTQHRHRQYTHWRDIHYGMEWMALKNQN